MDLVIMNQNYSDCESKLIKTILKDWNNDCVHLLRKETVCYNLYQTYNGF